ncbi:MAG: DUF4292 domain-containing protein [Bacteroidales bacterium]
MKKIISRNLSFYIFLFFLLTIVSCKTRKSGIGGPVVYRNSSVLLEKMDSSELDYKTLSFKFKGKLKREKDKKDFSGQVRIQKDSLIWISFSKAFVEGGRVLITRDSVFFVNRLDREYFKGNFNLLSRILKTRVDFDMMQALLTGNDFTSFEKGDFNASVEGRRYRLTNENRRKIRKSLRSKSKDLFALFHQIWLNPETYKIEEVFLKEMGKDHKKLNVVYDGFNRIDESASDKNQLFPGVITIKYLNADRITLDLLIQKTEVNKELKFPFRISRKYVPMEVAGLGI